VTVTAPLLEPTSIEAWCHRLVGAWRAARLEASVEGAAHAEAGILHLDPPLQLTAIIGEDARTGSRAVGFALERDPTQADGLVEVIPLATIEAKDDDDRAIAIAARGVASSLENLVRNWYPGRPVVDVREGPRIGMAQRLQDDNDTAVWIVAGDPSAADVGEIVEAAFTPRQAATTSQSPKPFADEPQLWRSKRRSDAAMSIWLEHNAGDLLRELGINGPFWCGLNLPRGEVLGPDNDGDLDLIGGPLEWKVEPEEWLDRTHAIARQFPPTAHHSIVQEWTARTAADEGRLKWPPSIDHLVAIEAVSSYYDVEAKLLKRTLAGREMRRIEGQLGLLHRNGLDRFGMLHLIATKPGEPTATSPWFQSGHASGSGLDAVERLRDAVVPARPTRAGVFRAAMGAVGELSERTAGSESALQVIRPATGAANGTAATAVWRREVLLPRLAALGNPRAFCAYIRSCRRCGHWYWSPWSPFGTCACTRGGAADAPIPEASPRDNKSG
jgi:hypothetical protein